MIRLYSMLGTTWTHVRVVHTYTQQTTQHGLEHILTLRQQKHAVSHTNKFA